MKKIALQFSILILLFFACWYVLSQIDWVTLFDVKQFTQTTEEKLGDLIWEVQDLSGKEINDKALINPVDSILTRICKANELDRNRIKVHLIKNEEINAFALPNNHLIINSGLINYCENPEELSGVLSHEIAHMELNHIMKKLTQEIGLSALLSVTKGKDIKVLKEIAGTLSSSAYSRKLEKEADIKGVDYLLKAHIHPKYLADFLFRLSSSTSAANKYLSWINTHPDSEERAVYLIKYGSNTKMDEKSLLTESTWNRLKEAGKE